MGDPVAWTTERRALERDLPEDSDCPHFRTGHQVARAFRQHEQLTRMLARQAEASQVAANTTPRHREDATMPV